MKPNNKESNKSEQSAENTIRLNKYVANSGVCSRRKADEYIKEGLVTVNGKEVLEMGYRVKEGEVVKFRGKLIKPIQNHVYVLLNKPKNTITTTHDPQGRKTVMDLVKKASDQRLYPVGRLDRNTTGILLLTNDGDMAQKLAHPSFEVRKIYQAFLDKELTKKDFNKIQAGLTLEDGPVAVDDLAYVQGDKKRIGLEIHLGRNRIVRRIFEHLGYEVEKLDRVLYAELTKKNLPRGKWRFLTEGEIIQLKKS